MSNGYFIPLQNRGAVQVSGPDARTLLQALVSNDVNLLDSQKLVYACLLTPQGKFLHDFFMSEQMDTITLECEGGTRARMLMTRLNFYKLRSKITLDCTESFEVFATEQGGTTREAIYQDPRHSNLGYRTYLKPTDKSKRNFEDWDRHRILLGIPDGSRDMDIEKSTLEEANIDQINGISYTKGCYLGQELTARMHHRGLGKKHLVAIKTADPQTHPLPAHGTDIRHGHVLVGEMRSSCGDVGLALVKDENAALLQAAGFEIIPK